MGRCQLDERAQVFFSRQFVLQRRRMADEHHVLAQRRCKRCDGLAAPSHRARIGHRESGQDAKQRRLAGTIRAGDEQRPPRVDAKRNSRKQRSGAAARGQVLRFEHRGGRRLRRSAKAHALCACPSFFRSTTLDPRLRGNDEKASFQNVQ
jgi:hypothetical protein